MKLHYKIDARGKNALVYRRTFLTPWEWCRIVPASTVSIEEIMEKYSLPTNISLYRIVIYYVEVIAGFLRTFKFWYCPSRPLKLYGEASDVFKKLPSKVSFERWAPDLEYDNRRLRWYNFVHLYVSDVDFKYKWHSYVFIASPVVALTFFGKWSVKWEWTIGFLDDLYWECLLEYLDGQLTKEQLPQLQWYSSLNPEDKYNIKSYLK